MLPVKFGHLKWAVLGCLLTGIILFFSYHQHKSFSDTTIEHFNQDQTVLALALQHLLIENVDEAVQNLDTVKRAIQETTDDVHLFSPLLNAVYKNHMDDFSLVALLDGKGNRIIGFPESSDQEEGAFKEVIPLQRPGKQPFLSSRYFRAGEAKISIFLPVERQNNGGQKFLIQGEMRIESFMRDHMPLPEPVKMSLILSDADGNILSLLGISHDDSVKMQKGNLFHLDSLCISCHSADDFDDIRQAFRKSGPVRTIYSSPNRMSLNRSSYSFNVLDTKMAVILTSQFGNVQKEIEDNFRQSLTFSFAAVLLVLFISYFAYKAQHDTAILQKEKQSIEEISKAFLAVQESESKYLSLFRKLNEGVAIHSILHNDKGEAIDYLITDVNPAFDLMFGSRREDIIGRRASQFFNTVPPPYLGIFSKVAFSGVPETFEAFFDSRNKYFIVSAFSPKADTVVALFTDITESKKLSEQLFQSQKMEAVGHLAGGIAHDFNNILTAIMGFGDILKHKLTGQEPLIMHVEKILSAAERAAHLTSSLLAFSRRQEIDPRPINLNKVLTNVTTILRRLIGEQIEYKASLCSETLMVMADRVKIEQVIFNLANNARDAMLDGGLFQIETGIFIVEDDQMKDKRFIKTGPYALIRVSDTGHGMDEIVKDKVFEPFFSTKPMGKGTGLGLSIVYGIITLHGGVIDVSSEQGKGTTFSIYLPLISPTSEAGEMQISASVIQGGNETILIAEDEASVRDFAREALSHAGYKILEAETGQQAIDIFRKNKSVIRLLLLDLIMPQKNGSEVYEEVRDIEPGIKVLFMSGYMEESLQIRFPDSQKAVFLKKPFSSAELLSRVRDILDGK